MEVKIDKLKSELNEYNTLLNEYEDIYLNLYNVFSMATDYWQDGTSNIFLQNVTKEKMEVKTTIEELKSIKSIYQFMIDRYSELGNKIIFNLQNRTNVINKLDNYINSLNDIINSYSKLNLGFCGSEASYIRTEKQKLINMKNNVLSIKEKFKKSMDIIEETEKTISSRISNLKIAIIKENDISNLV